MGKVVIYHGDNVYEEILEHINKVTEGQKVIAIIPDIEKYPYYKNKRWIFRSGMGINDINMLGVTKYEVVLLEPYDVTDMNNYFRRSKLLKRIFRTGNTDLYVIMNQKLDLKLSDRIEKEFNGKVLNINNGKTVYKTVLTMLS